MRWRIVSRCFQLLRLNAKNPNTAALEQHLVDTEALISQPEKAILEGKFYTLWEYQTRSRFEPRLDETLVEIFLIVYPASNPIRLQFWRSPLPNKRVFLPSKRCIHLS